MDISSIIFKNPEPIAVHSPEVDALAQQTAMLHIPDSTKMTTQVIEEPLALVIDKCTGHIQSMAPKEMIATHWAMGPDEPDTPEIPNYFERIGRGGRGPGGGGDPDCSPGCGGGGGPLCRPPQAPPAQ